MDVKELNQSLGEYFNPVVSKDEEMSPDTRILNKHEDASTNIPYKKVLNETGICYPLDIWYILAKYIEPEQVQTFTCICRGSYFAINSKRFWTGLYKRYITTSISLPTCLKPNIIAKTSSGLKTRVVRALFLAHTTLNSRVLKEESLKLAYKLLQQLVGLRCCNTWYKIENTSKSSHTYLFRFQRHETDIFNDKSLAKLHGIHNANNFLSHNDDKDYVVLQVKVRDFTHVQFTSDTLLDFSMGRNTVNKTLRMVFGSSNQDDKQAQHKKESVVLNSVSSIQLLRWWHPSYPYSD